MKTIRAAIEIAQAQEVVFDLTQNYAKRLEWDVESTGQRNTLFQYLLWGFKVKCFSRSFI